MIERAKQLATEKHKGQFRKDNKTPYVEHCRRVSELVKEHFPDGIEYNESKFTSEELISAAWLHDTLEDTDIKTSEIDEKCSVTVRKLVEELTNVQSDVEKKQMLYEKLRKMSVPALCIKLCDRLDNINDMKNMDKVYILSKCKETAFILSNLFSDRKKLGHIASESVNLSMTYVFCQICISMTEQLTILSSSLLLQKINS